MAEADVLAKLEAIHKDLRKVLLDFDQLRNEVRDMPPKIESLEAKVNEIGQKAKGF